MKIRPLADRIVAKKVIQEEVKKGGLILPDSSKNQQNIVEILAVGPGKMNDKGIFIPVAAKPGDKVILDKYSGQEVTFDDENYIILKADDIIGIIE